MIPAEPRGAESQLPKLHREHVEHPAIEGIPGMVAYCAGCLEVWPCDAFLLLSEAESLAAEVERLELQLFNCIGGPHTGHRYTHGITGEVTYCCPAHQDGYAWLDDARASVARLEPLAKAALLWRRDPIYQHEKALAVAIDDYAAALSTKEAGDGE